MKKKPLILHVDGDNFFVACEVARFPHLRGKPVIVGEERGIACAMSQEAKKLGVGRGMPVFQIRQKFPQVTVLPSHFELYDQYNEKLVTVLQKYCDTVERYSIDECFAILYQEDLDLYQECYGKSLLETIKVDAERSLGITLSFGLASTKTLSKIASKKEKPSGCVIINEKNRVEILQNTSIGQVWGIGKAISAKLTSFNIHTAYSFTQQGSQFIEKNFGKNTLDTWYELRGEPRSEVIEEYSEQKSFQSTRSFGMSTKERSFLFSELCTNTEVLCARLRQHRLKTNRVSFFLKKNALIRKYLSTELDIGFYTDNPSDLLKRIRIAFDELYDDPENFGLQYKATGVSIYRLKPHEAIQDDLFASQSSKDTQNSYMDAVDTLHKRFGDNSIHLCSSLESRTRRIKAHKSRNIKNQFIYGLPLPYLGEVS